MVIPRKNVLDGLLTGSLAASTTIISDSIVQPALLLFRQLIDTKLERGESVCLVCCEIDGNRFVESLTPSLATAGGGGDDENKKLSRLQVLDANLDYDSDDTTQAQAIYKTHSFDVDDVAGLSKLLQEVNDKEEHTTVFFDSINALETFNSTHAVLRMFRQCKQQIVAIHHTDVPTSPEGEEEGSSSSSSKSQLLPSLLTASGSRSSIHLTLHPCSLLSHLHYIYGIENVGQSKPLYNDSSPGPLADEEDNEIDIRVYQFLELLHHRGWGSPLANRAEQEETHDDEESYGGREYDSPSSSRVIIDLLGSSGKSSSSHGSAAGRCVVEYALRGVNKSNKRSVASKIVRGLEGLKYDNATTKQQLVAVRTRLLSATNVSEVLRIKARGAKGSGQRDESKSSAADPWSSMTMFNLSLTDRQREEKERVELPFTRGGGEANGSGAIIIYEPDSADDLDESDPDEDLEI